MSTFRPKLLIFVVIVANEDRIVTLTSFVSIGKKIRFLEFIVS